MPSCYPKSKQHRLLLMQPSKQLTSEFAPKRHHNFVTVLQLDASAHRPSSAAYRNCQLPISSLPSLLNIVPANVWRKDERSRPVNILRCYYTSQYCTIQRLAEGRAVTTCEHSSLLLHFSILYQPTFGGRTSGHDL